MAGIAGRHYRCPIQYYDRLSAIANGPRGENKATAHSYELIITALSLFGIPRLARSRSTRRFLFLLSRSPADQFNGHC